MNNDFQFRCRKCRRLVEVKGRFGQSPEPPPPCECGGEWVRKYGNIGFLSPLKTFYIHNVLDNEDGV